MAQYTLDEAIAGALATDKSERVSLWRDAIAEHGAAGIDAVMEWAGDADMGAFAVTVIEAAGRRGAIGEAVSALRGFRSIGATSFVRAFADQALGRLLPKATNAARSVEVIPARAGLDWPGFKAADFGAVAGTTWRSRYSPIAMIPLILRPLRELDPNFSTYPIYALPEIQIADRDRYEQGAEKEQGWRASKLVIYAHGDDERVAAHIALGYWVEKGTGTDNFGTVDRALWDWPRALDFIADERDARQLQAVMERHEMSFGDYVGGRFGEPGDDLGFAGRLEAGELVLRDRTGSEIDRGWPNLVGRLASLPDDRWYGFHLWKEWPAAEAIADGHPFAVERLLPVLLDLASIYLQIISPSNAGRD